MHWTILSLATCAALLLGGCSDEPSARVYTIPKEEPTTARQPAGMSAGSSSMANQSLPPGMTNANAVPPGWEVPGSWQSRPPSSMRLATFVMEGEGGAAELAVTSFPGDVGGLLANVNRWRGQLGLPPTSQEALQEQIERVPTPSGEAVVASFDNDGTATRVAILMHDNASWFFKLTGPTRTVENEAGNFDAFVRSLDFAATHNH